MEIVKGIPYLGENNNELREQILNKSINETIEESLYEFINSRIDNIENLLVVIDNKWLTWLKDLRFNYRDKKLELPYWKYELHKLEYKRAINKYQYIIQDDENGYIRYNYSLHIINFEDTKEIIIFDLNKNTKFKLRIKGLCNLKTYSINELYNLYINSSYTQDFELEGNESGYYYIEKRTKHLKNEESYMRYKLDLNSYKDNLKYDISDYRDVRKFTKGELQLRYGMICNFEGYKIRRLKFESLLFCIIHNGLESDSEEFNKEFKQLGKQKEIIKYKTKDCDICLIFKSYWLPYYKKLKHQSWMRAIELK